MAIDARWMTTPAGAAIGLVLARKAIPKRSRGLTADLAGLGIGGGAGYLAGGMYEDAKRNYGEGSEGPRDLAKDIRANPSLYGSEPTTKEMDAALPPDTDLGLPKSKFTERLVYNNYATMRHMHALNYRIKVLEKALEGGLIDPAQVPAAKSILDANRKALEDIRPGVVSKGLSGLTSGIGAGYDWITGIISK